MIRVGGSLDKYEEKSQQICRDCPLYLPGTIEIDERETRHVIIFNCFYCVCGFMPSPKTPWRMQPLETRGEPHQLSSRAYLKFDNREPVRESVPGLGPANNSLEESALLDL